MLRRAALVVLVPLLLHVGIVSMQESSPVMERVAQKIIQYDQTASCQDVVRQQNQLISLVQPGTDPSIKEPGDLCGGATASIRPSRRERVAHLHEPEAPRRIGITTDAIRRLEVA